MTVSLTIDVQQLTETKELAKDLAEKLQPGDVITLEGDLGAGKTTFTKALAEAFGVPGNVNSPTFTIMKEYMGRLAFYHMDAYRIEAEDEDLGLDEYFDSGGVVVIEWPSMIASQLPDARLDILITYTGPDTRTMTITAHGKRYEALIKEIKKA
ncbi:tRNA (adenosine(37)-N6)-threonylcarbamoyltransferase complex ATPase subunit type 1 TsaE [Salisediminibacterium beveridgei]|uniref:tRNA threonylcarbamoyladenosine biosynthesis protein TsaE n=1 Tax=Salisediminibacterium beveridgei TaxID=632773 RepID=A0A1D7QYN7_9BACI|nr:tRNA (adenosine(37)-N6)-threonylcarbamoyltransferase complex ATPase subunit type 1 TsaE [Salisediminibacterium beveridgei]AOM84119.1 conserved hypothetical protein with ATP-binding domain [Salisediminibacterium beveridgei]